MAQFAANPTDYYSGNLFLGEDIFLDFEKADFDSVWGESLTTGIPSDWLSEEEDILFDTPKAGFDIKSTLQTDNTSLQQAEGHKIMAISQNQDSGNESGDMLEEIFGINTRPQDELVLEQHEGHESNADDPMLSSSFELATPQHPFEEALSSVVVDDSADYNNQNSITSAPITYSPTSTIYYNSSAEEEEDEEAKENNTDTDSLPSGYPHSIHSYSQQIPTAQQMLDDDLHLSDNDEQDEAEGQCMEVEHISQAHDIQQQESLHDSPKRVRNRRRQRKSRVFKVTLTEQKNRLVNSPAKKTFSNGKAKLYATKPLADPKAERARLNALNAKKNRDRKRMEQEAFQNEVVTLRQENGTLKVAAAAMRKRAAEAEAELRRLQAAIRTNQLEDIIKAAGKQQQQRIEKSQHFAKNRARARF